MLNQLCLRNFKAWRNLDVEFGRVTALFGRNSSGKSSILHFLLLLKQTKNASDRSLVLDFGGGPSEFVHLGSFETTVHRGGTAFYKHVCRHEWDAAKASIMNATDSDWTEHAELTDRLGVHVQQLCPTYAIKQGRK